MTPRTRTLPTGKPFLDVFQGAPGGDVPGNIASAPPIWLMRQAGRYLPEYHEVRRKAGGFLNLCLTPALACEATLQPVRRFKMSAAILFADILLLPHALGRTVSFETGSGPQLEPLPAGAAMTACLAPESLHEGLASVYETVRQVRCALPDDVALIGFAGAPWTVACYMIAGRATSDQAPARLAAYRDRVGFSALMEVLETCTAAYLEAQVEAGAEAVQVFDTWAQGLPEEQFRRWCLAPMARITARLRRRWQQLPIVGFPRGAGPLYESYLAGTGVSGVSVDAALPLDFICDRLQGAGVVQGNLDPVVLLAGGEELRQAVRRIMQTLGRKRFVFNLGHGVLPSTPPAHVADLVALVRNHED